MHAQALLYKLAVGSTLHPHAREGWTNVLSVELTQAPPHNPLHRSRIIEMTQTLYEAQKPLDLTL